MRAIQEPSDLLAVEPHDGFASRVYDTVVIGAGIAGLAAALDLHRRNASVLVLEASPDVGGAIRTFRSDGYLVERGPNTVLHTRPEVGALIDAMGLGEERIFASDAAKNRYVVRGGALHALPMSPGSLLKTRLFTTKAKLRVAAEPLIWRAVGDADESVASFTERRLGREFLDYAIDPFVSGVYAGKPESLSVRHAFPKLEEVERKYGSLIVGQIRGAHQRKRRSDTPRTAARMFSFSGGLERLPRAVAGELGDAVRTGCRVTSIVFGEPVWLIRYESADGATRVVPARSVVYAAGLQKAALLEPLTRFFGVLEKVEYPPLSVVALGFRQEDVSHPLDGFGLLIPSREDCSTLGALFSSTLFPGRAPKDHVLLTAFVGGARAPETARLNDQRLLAAVTADLKYLVGLKAAPRWYDVTRWEQAIPQYNLGYGAVKEAIADMEHRHAGFFLAGNCVAGISVADSIASGTGAAERVRSFLQSPRVHTLPVR